MGFVGSKIASNKSLVDINQIFKNNLVGNGRYHVNRGDSLNLGIDKVNPLAFLSGGGQQGSGVMSALTAATAEQGQQSYGRLLNNKVPKAFKF